MEWSARCHGSKSSNVHAQEQKRVLRSPRPFLFEPSGPQTPLVLAIGELVVDRAELVPRERDLVRDLRVRDVLGHDDREPGVEVEVDVAVEEPRAGVVRLEPDRDVVARATCADGGAPDRVLEVVPVLACALDDREDVLEGRGSRGSVHRFSGIGEV